MQVWSLGQEDLLEEGRATHSIIFAWRILRIEEPEGPQSIGMQRVRHEWSDLAHMQTHLDVNWMWLFIVLHCSDIYILIFEKLRKIWKKVYLLRKEMSDPVTAWFNITLGLTNRKENLFGSLHDDKVKRKLKDQCPWSNFWTFTESVTSQ